MIRRVNEIIYGVESDDNVKFIMESSHDTQLLSTLLWLEPQDYDFNNMPFASSIYFEVHYNTTCLAKEKDSSCFTVEIFHNGNPLKLDKCIQENKARGSTSTICQFDDFINYFDSRYQKGDLMELCQQGYNPYPQSSIIRPN